MLKPYYTDDATTLYHGSFFDLAGQLPAASFDCIVTDPPYWTLDKWRAMGTTTRLGGNSDEAKRSGWFKTINEAQLRDALVACNWVLKLNCHAYFMCDGQTLRSLLMMAGEAGSGWANFKPIVWDKVAQGMGYHYRCRHEYFVMLDKGKNRRLNSLSTPDVWTVPMIRGYPTEKPVDLMKIPIEHSTAPGEVILDPFCGGGSSLVAAKLLGRRAVGFDISEEACEITARRLSGKPAPVKPTAPAPDNNPRLFEL